MKQDVIFYKSEGDEWFKRNRSLLVADPRTDHVIALLEMYGITPKRVLEVGASNGWRLARIADMYGATCLGIEPSAKAVADGNKLYKKIKMKRGVASDIPVNETFDLVVVNLVLHWVPREELLHAVSEIDRCVADGGYLVVGDFDPDEPTHTKYHHLPKKEIYTYKQDYAKIFTSSAVYRSLAHVTFDHDDHTLAPRTLAHDRAVTTLLRKSLSEYYAPGERGK